MSKELYFASPKGADIVFDANSVIANFVWHENGRAQKCGCHGCKTDATDRVDWFLGIGEWYQEKSLTVKHKVVYTSQTGDDEPFQEA